MSLYLPGGHAAHVPVAIASDLYSPNPQITGVGACVGTGVGIGVGGAGHPCAQHRQPTSVSLAQLRLVWLKQQESATSPQPDSVHLSLHSAGQQNADFVDTMPPAHHGDAPKGQVSTKSRSPQRSPQRRKRAAAIVRC